MAPSTSVPSPTERRNQFTIGDVGRGVELSGGHNYGGYHYSIAIIDQNTSGISQSSNSSPFIPSPTGGNNGGIGFASDSNFKDIYARFAYRFNLERDQSQPERCAGRRTDGSARSYCASNLGTTISTALGAASSPAGPRGRDALRSLLPASPTTAQGGLQLQLSETFQPVRAIYGGARQQPAASGCHGRSHPSSGVPHKSSAGRFHIQVPAKFNGGFVQADYLIYLPWVMLIGRWDGVNSSADRINGLALATGTRFSARSLLPATGSRPACSSSYTRTSKLHWSTSSALSSLRKSPATESQRRCAR